jgi:hypothetical protein
MTITNSTQNVSCYGYNGTNPSRMVVDGSGHLKVNVENALTIDPDGLATDALQTDGNASLSSIDGKITACNTGAVVVSSGSVSVDNFPATQPVSGSVSVDNFPATQPVSAIALPLPAGASTDALQTAGNATLTTIAGDTTSLDAKITACNTGAVVVSSSVLPTGGSTDALQTTGNSSLSSIDGKITACDTGAVVVSNITNCDTGNISGSVSVSNNTDPATATLQTAGNSSLTAIQGSHYIEGGSIGVSDTGVLIMGRNGTNAAKPIHITNNGDVEVEIADFVKGQAVMASSFPVVISSDQSTLTINNPVVASGTYNNLANDETIAAGALSTLTASTSNMRNCNILYQDTATTAFDSVDIEVSGDSGTNYQIVSQIYPQPNAGGTLRYGYYSFACGGITNVRIKNASATDSYTNVKCSVFGST